MQIDSLYKANLKNQGFTLIELAIVLVVLGFVLTAILAPLRVQQEQAALLQTRNTLDQAKQALIGFAQTNGRLPCPATAVSNGVEQPLGGGVCTSQFGFLPASTLGIQPTNNTGFAIDAWNNPIFYTITNANTSAFSTPGSMASVSISTLVPDLRVRASSAAAAANLVTNAVAVIYSTGSTGRLGSAGKADELENLNNDTTFVSHDFNTPTNLANPNEFDHIVTWISPFVLYNAMIQAGQLH